jgi:hypothetical protein
MRATYRVLAHIIAGLVAFQAAVMVFAVAGLYLWIDEGNTMTKATFEADKPPDFTGSVGFGLHFMGAMLIVLIALVLLIVSFFAKVPGGAMWAGIVFLTAILQFAFGIFGHEVAISGMLHGLNALVLFTVALQAGRRVSRTADVAPVPEVAASP